VPELPEVETMVRGIRPAVEGRTVADVVLCPCDCKPFTLEPTIGRLRKRLVGRRIVRVHRLAKRIVLETDAADRLVVEPRMTGLLLIADPPDVEHLRLRIDFEDGPRILGPSVWFWDRRGLGTARLYSAKRYATDLGPSKLGPDALEMPADEWYARCRRTNRAIKVALLDQRFVAGIGNLYASEILHVAGIRPTRRANGLSRAAVVRMRRATLDILETAIRFEGSTLGDGTYRNALNQNGGYQNHHRVYAREGHPCPTCHTPIRRLVQAQRSTFYCARCQR
jgi:formamidopyrimidine-DNA glycosylase